MTVAAAIGAGAASSMPLGKLKKREKMDFESIFHFLKIERPFGRQRPRAKRIFQIF
jgi:hypothetical protein